MITGEFLVFKFGSTVGTTVISGVGFVFREMVRKGVGLGVGTVVGFNISLRISIFSVLP